MRTELPKKESLEEREHPKRGTRVDERRECEREDEPSMSIREEEDAEIEKSRSY